MSRRVAIGLTALCAGAFCAPSASGQSSSGDNGQLGISPAKRDVLGKPPKSLGYTLLSNGTSETFDMKVYAVFLKQQIDGSLTFPDDARSLREAGLILDAAPSSFTIGPHDARKVVVHWNTMPSHAPAVYLGLIFQGTPKTTAGQPVPNILRLLSTTFLTLPGPPTTSGSAIDSPIAQTAPGQISFFPTAENSSLVIGTPSGAEKVTEGSCHGKTVFTAVSGGDFVLPSAKREFPVKLTKVLQKGHYCLTTRMRMGHHRSVFHKSFTLVGPNTLPSPGVAIEGFHGTAIIGAPPQVRATVISKGTAPLTTNVSLALYRYRGPAPAATPLATKRIAVKNLAPGKKLPINTPLGPASRPGTYRVILRYRDPVTGVQQLVVDFAPTRPLQHKKGSSFPWWILLLILVLLALAAEYWRRRRNREAPAEPVTTASVAAPAPAAPAAGGVDINTAGQDELAQIPGVGPRAAARIIEHREEYGRFGSLDELSAVEGFDAERIERLRPHARV